MESPPLGVTVEIIRLVVEAAAFLWVVLKGMRSFALLEAGHKVMMDNHIPHLLAEIQQLNERLQQMNQRIDALVTMWGPRT